MQHLKQVLVDHSININFAQQVSCDNYLSDAKFALSRRDSVGSGSPHSSKGSPRRWAAKADEITAGPVVATAVAADGGEAVAVMAVQARCDLRSIFLA